MRITSSDIKWRLDNWEEFKEAMIAINQKTWGRNTTKAGLADATIRHSNETIKKFECMPMDQRTSFEYYKYNRAKRKKAEAEEELANGADIFSLVNT